MSQSAACPTPVPAGFGFALRFLHGEFADCALPCEHGLLGKYAAPLEYVALTFGIITCVLIAIALLSYLLGTSSKVSHNYPEKATIYMLFCHFVISIVLVVSASNQKEIGCVKINGESFRVQANNKIGCTMTHSVLLYFFLSSQIWWLIYSVSIYLYSKTEWCAETITRKVENYKNLAWLIPAIITMISIIIESISNDISTGSCFIASGNVTTNFVFVVVPMILAMSIGMILFTLASCNFRRTRKHFQESSDANKDTSEKFEAELPANQLKSMKSYVSRISGFYLNYYMLSQALAFAFIYQSFNEAKWHSEFFRAYCAANSSDAGCASTALKHSTAQINKEVFAIGLLKTLAWNSAGLVCITWAVSVHSCAKLKTILRRSRINRASFS